MDVGRREKSAHYGRAVERSEASKHLHKPTLQKRKNKHARMKQKKARVEALSARNRSRRSASNVRSVSPSKMNQVSQRRLDAKRSRFEFSEDNESEDPARPRKKRATQQEEEEPSNVQNRFPSPPSRVLSFKGKEKDYRESPGEEKETSQCERIKTAGSDWDNDAPSANMDDVPEGGDDDFIDDFSDASSDVADAEDKEIKAVTTKNRRQTESQTLDSDVEDHLDSRKQRFDTSYTPESSDAEEARGIEVEDALEDDSDFSDEEDLLLEVVRSQRAYKLARLQESDSKTARMLSSNSKKLLGVISQGSDGPSAAEGVELSRRELWLGEYLHREASFFNSDEARMLQPVGKTVTKNGKEIKKHYLGVGITVENNADLSWCYSPATAVDRAAAEVTSETFNNFRTCVRQLARFAIANKKVDAESLYKPGHFFRLCTNAHTFEAFINSFEKDGCASTAMSKAGHCGNFAKQARDYFKIHAMYPADADKNLRVDGKIAKTIKLCQRLHSRNKHVGRKKKALMKTKSFRVSTGRYLDNDDIIMFRKEATNHLSSILRTVQSAFRDVRAKDFQGKMRVVTGLFQEKSGLISKWSINFLAAMIFFGNGQRTQVYTFLKVPEISELELWEEENGGVQATTLVEILINEKEKRPRDVLLPSLMVDPVMYPFVKFQAEYFLPYLYKKHSIPRHDPKRAYLMIHTKYGKKLTTDNVRRTLSKFCQSKTAKEINVTPSIIRASYASFMIESFIQDKETGMKKWGIRTVDEFIEKLALVMNTSKEQITEVYAFSNRRQNVDALSKLFGIVSADESGLIDEDRQDLLNMVSEV